MAIRIDKVLPGNVVDHEHKEADISDLGDYVKTSGDTMTGDLDTNSSSELKTDGRSLLRYLFMMGG